MNESEAGADQPPAVPEQRARLVLHGPADWRSTSAPIGAAVASVEAAINGVARGQISASAGTAIASRVRDAPEILEANIRVQPKQLMARIDETSEGRPAVILPVYLTANEVATMLSADPSRVTHWRRAMRRCLPPASTASSFHRERPLDWLEHRTPKSRTSPSIRRSSAA